MFASASSGCFSFGSNSSDDFHEELINADSALALGQTKPVRSLYSEQVRTGWSSGSRAEERDSELIDVVADDSSIVRIDRTDPKQITLTGLAEGSTRIAYLVRFGDEVRSLEFTQRVASIANVAVTGTSVDAFELSRGQNSATRAHTRPIHILETADDLPISLAALADDGTLLAVGDDLLALLETRPELIRGRGEAFKLAAGSGRGDSPLHQSAYLKPNELGEGRIGLTPIKTISREEHSESIVVTVHEESDDQDLVVYGIFASDSKTIHPQEEDAPTVSFEVVEGCVQTDHNVASGYFWYSLNEGSACKLNVLRDGIQVGSVSLGRPDSSDDTCHYSLNATVPTFCAAQ